MKLQLPSFLSSLFVKSAQNQQTTVVKGNNNVVHQTIVLSSGPDDAAQQEILGRVQSGALSVPRAQIDQDAGFDVESEEIKLITAYRQLATDGESTTALGLLEKLKVDPRYQSGHVAFRLNFNIGIIQQNIGDLERATVSLRAASAFSPDESKAKTGLALAELNDRNFDIALRLASQQIAVDGDHQNLAAIVSFFAARLLRINFDIDLSDGAPKWPAEVFAARLEYLEVVKTDDFPAALNDAFAQHGSNPAIRGLWASNVLNDVKQNQAFILGGKVSEVFEKNISASAEIFKEELEQAIKCRPPNKLLLPFQANNAGVAMRLAGRAAEAAKLLDQVLALFPELTHDLAELRSSLYLQEEKDGEAFNLVEPIKENAELQTMAAEIEAKMGSPKAALERLRDVLKLDMADKSRILALTIKGRIALRIADRGAADEVLDEMAASFPDVPERVVFRSAYDRAFVIKHLDQAEEEAGRRHPKGPASAAAQRLLDSVRHSGEWDFITTLHTAEELVASEHYRPATDLLRDKVSFARESVALQLLCDACVSAGMGTLCKEIASKLSPSVRSSVFGKKFLVNVAYLSGEVAKAVPLAKSLFEENPKSIRSLSWYMQTLMRLNDTGRMRRVVSGLEDDELVGTLSEKREYVNLLVFCGELPRARAYAYRLFFENRNDSLAWMALSSAVLAIGRPSGVSDTLDMDSVAANAAFVVSRPDGREQTYVIEDDSRLSVLREENIGSDHLIAKAARGLKEGNRFFWPFGDNGDEATVLSVKHKAVDAFHFVLRRFEEQFPGINGFKSVSIDPSHEGGLDEMKAILQQRAEYAQRKADEYGTGKYPLVVLAHVLGIDVISAFAGIYNECGIGLQVSSCREDDQGAAAAALKQARRSGIIADPVACYLIRRLGLEHAVERAFGKIGVTQHTIDIFAKRLHDAGYQSSNDEDGGTKSGTISVRDGQLLLTEIGAEEFASRLALIRADLVWLQEDCSLVPAVASTDPDDQVIAMRDLEFGGFVDDLLAADGSGRVLISDDFHTRALGQGIFGAKSAWIQALIFHLEESGFISIDDVVRMTIQLSEVGEQALSVSSARIHRAAQLFASERMTEREFELICGLLGQSGAEYASHIPVAANALDEIWNDPTLISVRGVLIGVILRKLIRNSAGSYREILAALKKQIRRGFLHHHIEGWQAGHFLK